MTEIEGTDDFYVVEDEEMRNSSAVIAPRTQHIDLENPEDEDE
jgi:hypothetical protein